MMITAVEREKREVETLYQPIAPLMVELESRIGDVVDSAPPAIQEQLGHTLKSGGKRLRPAVALLAATFGRADPISSIPAAEAIELLHTATLVHDDTIDNALLRRGKLTANRLWGARQALLIGDYLCAASAYVTAETSNVRVMSLYARVLSDLCKGAAEEYAARYPKSRQEYFTTVERKTASLFSAGAESGALLSNGSTSVVRALKNYGRDLGMSFQVVDDILDVSSDTARGIFNLPAIMFLERAENARVRDILFQDREKGARILAEEIPQSPVIEECYRIARGFSSRACHAIGRVPRDEAYRSLVDLAWFLIERKS